MSRASSDRRLLTVAPVYCYWSSTTRCLLRRDPVPFRCTVITPRACGEP